MKNKTKPKTVYRIADVAQKKGIENPHQLHLRTGISIPRSKRLWVGKGQIRLNDIDAICDTLPCDVHEIFERVSTKEKNA